MRLGDQRMLVLSVKTGPAAKMEAARPNLPQRPPATLRRHSKALVAPRALPCLRVSPCTAITIFR